MAPHSRGRSLIDKGYYSFTKDNIKYRFDTFHKNHEVNVYVKILEETDSTLFQKYRLDSIYVFINTYKEQANVNTSIIERRGNIIFVQSKDKSYNENFIQKNTDLLLNPTFKTIFQVLPQKPPLHFFDFGCCWFPIVIYRC